MTGIYQPAIVRRPEGARVYSSGVVAAGVADARRLTRFEVRAVGEGGWPIVSDSLVPVAIVAAYYGLKLAACGIVQAPRSERE
jgi:purine nucleoside phosphorylase